jgi:hypothetical protein
MGEGRKSPVQIIAYERVCPQKDHSFRFEVDGYSALVALVEHGSDAVIRDPP